MSDSLLYIAVDFGTSFTGYCFQFAGGKQIRQPNWGAEYGYNTPKTPTCILFDEKGKFLKFGYDAVITYTRTLRKNDAQKKYFFDNFKMELYGKELDKDLMITAKNGKKMRAMRVFSESLSYMKEHALKMIGRHTDGVNYSASDATWILTVPAIWNPAAKQFMRLAAIEAGLVTESNPERLIVALEPEAASVWCKQLPSEGFMEGDLEAESIDDVLGTQYIVVDCGGGTIDITVHGVVNGGRLKELHRVSGNNMGGQTVDKNFRLFLRKIFSDKVFDKFEKKNPTESQKLMYDFLFCKRCSEDVSIQCPVSLQDIARKVKTMEAYFRGNTDADWDDGSIILSQDMMRSLHEDSLRAIEHEIQKILGKKTLNIRYMFLVGGFALSPHLQTFVRRKFESKCKVLCPLDAQLAVLKGAVRFGIMPNVVESRISLFTYGISQCVSYNEFKHRGKSTFVNKDGVKYCNVCFFGLVKKDESVRYDEVRMYTFGPVDREQTAISFRFYCTESKSAEFVDESGMRKIGSFSVSMPDIKRGMDRSVRLEVRFGFTEMTAIATDIDTGKTNSVKLDFMTK